jgi:hypothetical protein
MRFRHPWPPHAGLVTSPPTMTPAQALGANAYRIQFASERCFRTGTVEGRA